MDSSGNWKLVDDSRWFASIDLSLSLSFSNQTPATVFTSSMFVWSALVQHFGFYEGLVWRTSLVLVLGPNLTLNFFV